MNHAQKKSPGNTKKNGESGFTLVEVLVALTIFAVGLIALAGMQLTGLQGNTMAQSMSAKNALADGVIEEFMAMDGADLTLSTAQVDYAWPTATDVDLEGAGTCSATVTVTPDPNLGSPAVTYTGLTQIQVTVTNQKEPAVVKTVMKRRY